MPRREKKYTLDTQLFINSFRNPKANEAIQRFHRAFAPFEYLSAIVIQELRAGATTAAAVRDLDRYIVRPFEKRRRIVTPTAAAWVRAGEVLADLRKAEGLNLKRMPRSFGNDVLLAASCRETGLVLVTENVADFERIAKHMDFDFVPPWPGPTK